MSGLDFGKELKTWREVARLSSRELSRRVGKAVTYVSQLERGLIKTPDYQTCYMLLKEVGIEESKIEEILNVFNIKSPERLREEELIEQHWIATEERRMREDPEGYMEYKYEQALYVESVRLKEINDRLHQTLNVLIERDFSKAETVMDNLDDLIRHKDDFSFFCSLFGYDYSSLSLEERDTLLQTIGRFFAESGQKKEEHKE